MTHSLGLALMAIFLVSACTSSNVRAPEADIQGVWRIVAHTPTGVHEADMHVVQDGRAISGRFEGALGVMHYTGTIDQRQIRFSHNAMHFEGTIAANVRRALRCLAGLEQEAGLRRVTAQMSDGRSPNS